MKYGITFLCMSLCLASCDKDNESNNREARMKDPEARRAAMLESMGTKKLLRYQKDMSRVADDDEKWRLTVAGSRNAARSPHKLKPL